MLAIILFQIFAFVMQLLKPHVFTIHKKVQICMTECVLIRFRLRGFKFNLFKEIKLSL